LLALRARRGTAVVSLTAVHVWAEPPRSGSDQFKPVVHDYDEARKEAARQLAESLAGFRRSTRTCRCSAS